MALKRPAPVLLKIGGEALSGPGKTGFNNEQINILVDEIADVVDDYALAIVVGGGNLFRGSKQGDELEMNKTEFGETMAHYAGMYATIINGIVLEQKLLARGIPTRHMCTLGIINAAEPFIYKRAIRHLEKRRTLILSGGIGQPHHTTDYAMVQYALGIGAGTVLKGTKVRGIFDGDPVGNPHANFIPCIRHIEYISKGYKIVDVDAVLHAQNQKRKVQITVFNIFKKGNLGRILRDEYGKGEEAICSIIMSF